MLPEKCRGLWPMVTGKPVTCFSCCDTEVVLPYKAFSQKLLAYGVPKSNMGLFLQILKILI